MTKSKFTFLATVLMLFALSAVAVAQTSKGFVVGTIVDQNGAAVAGATVKITNAETGVIRETTTQTDGSFRLDAVDPGTYRAEIGGSGFKSATRENILVAAAQHTDLSTPLEVGNPSEVVTALPAHLSNYRLRMELELTRSTRVRLPSCLSPVSIR